MTIEMNATKLVVRDVDASERFYSAMGLKVVSRNVGGEAEVAQKQCRLSTSGDRSTHMLILSPPCRLLLVGCAVVSLLACRSTPEPLDGDVIMPADLEPEVTRALVLGRELYAHDQISADATDLMIERVGSREAMGRLDLGGYLSIRGGTEEGVPDGSWHVFFYTAERPPRMAYTVTVWPGTLRSAEVKEHSPPQPIQESMLTWIEARQNAIDALDEHPQRLNPVVLPASAFDPTDPGILVYLIAGTTEADVVVLGRHHRVFVSADGRTVRRIEPLSKSILELRKSPDSKSLTITHLVSDTPIETHVLASLLHDRFPLFIGTERGMWSVIGDEIEFIVSWEEISGRRRRPW